MTKEQHYKQFAEALIKAASAQSITFYQHCGEIVINLSNGDHEHLDSWRSDLERIRQATKWLNSIVAMED